MPYFPHDNILLIHVPKTGGSSLEKYFAHRDPDVASKARWMQTMQANAGKYLYSRSVVAPHAHSLQHCTYEEIVEHHAEVLEKKPRILVTVRDPYERLVSELLWRYAKTRVIREAQAFVHTWLAVFEEQVETAGYGALDNHARPQNEFVRGIPEGTEVVVIRTERLQEDMRRAGFADFNVHENKNRGGIGNYRLLISDRVRAFVLKHYAEDFERFGYVV